MLRVTHVDTRSRALDRPRLAADRGPGIAALIGRGVGETERDAVEGAQPHRMDQRRIAVADGAEPCGRVADADVGVIPCGGARDLTADVLILTVDDDLRTRCRRRR